MPKTNPKRNHKGNAASLDPAYQFKPGNEGGPGRKPLSDTGRVMLSFVVPTETAQSLKNQAKMSGLTSSEYLRNIVTEAEIKARTL